MASSRFQLVALLVLIFSIVIAVQSRGGSGYEYDTTDAHAPENEVVQGACHLRGTCKDDSDCDTHCHRSTEPPNMYGRCYLDGPTGPVCCCLTE